MGQQQDKLAITYSAVDFSMKKGAQNGIISCNVKEGLLRKNDTGVKLFFYTRNDVRDIPMELMLKRKPLPPKRLKAAKNSSDNIVFRTHADYIFFTEDPKNGYSWKWRGRGRPPISPIVPVAGQEVKQLQCWFVLQVNKQQYISDTISIQVQ